MGNMCSDKAEEGTVSGTFAPTKSPHSSQKLLEKFLNELNNMRSNPPMYANKIEDLYVKKINGCDHVTYKSTYFEGKEAFKEAEMLLRKTPVLPAFSLEKGMVVTSYEQAMFLSQTKILDSQGRGGTSLKERLTQYGTLEGEKVAECSIILTTNDPTRILIELLADDGVITRKNRQALLCSAFSSVGVALVRDPLTAEYLVVIDLADSFSSESDKVPQNVLLKAEVAASK